MKLGLLLVDIQNDYFPGGRNPLVLPEIAAMQAKKILTFFRSHGLPVYHIRHISLSPDASFFLPDTAGIDFYGSVVPQADEIIITKHNPDSFLDTSLKERLEQDEVTDLVICGMMTHMCIDTTVRSAAAYNYPITLIADACATKDLTWEDNTVPARQVQDAYLAAIDGTFATVMRSEDWLNSRE